MPLSSLPLPLALPSSSVFPSRHRNAIRSLSLSKLYTTPTAPLSPSSSSSVARSLPPTSTTSSITLCKFPRKSSSLTTTTWRLYRHHHLHTLTSSQDINVNSINNNTVHHPRTATTTTTTTSTKRPLHITVIGAGIVGLSVAREVKRRHGSNATVTIVERDHDVALHQTGRNSGVLHAGIYYQPGSLKAILCKKGHSLTLSYCAKHNIPVSHVGKLIVAMDDAEVKSLATVYARGVQNEVKGLKLLHNLDDMLAIEPTLSQHAKQAVYSPVTAVVDWAAVAKSIANELKQSQNHTMSTQFLFNHSPQSVSSINIAMSTSGSGSASTSTSKTTSTSTFTSTTTAGAAQEKLQLRLKDMKTNSITTLLTDRVVTCAGVYADRVAHMLGGSYSPRIVPIRGEYLTLRHDLDTSSIPCTNIYPVPPLLSASSASASSKSAPFLGVHFTPRPSDGVTLVGPNAVPCLARDAYSWSLSRVRVGDVVDMLTYKGVWNLAKEHHRFVIDQVYKSLINQTALINEARRFVPSLEVSDFVRPTEHTSGIRAQAVAPNGTLLDDFVFEAVYDGRVLHVRNAPSPAATSSLAIAEVIVDRLNL